MHAGKSSGPFIYTPIVAMQKIQATEIIWVSNELVCGDFDIRDCDN